MTICKKTVLLVALFSSIAVQAQQQSKVSDNKNAALIYRMAFDELQDFSGDYPSRELMNNVLSGTAPWDEEHLGPILDRNRETILMMQRGTSLPECDWKAVRQGADILKTWNLQRLNALEGWRLMAHGDSDAAVETWLKGLKFAHHANSMPRIAGFFAAEVPMETSISALTLAAEKGLVSNASLKTIKAALEQMPPDVIDWKGPLESEAAEVEFELIHDGPYLYAIRSKLVSDQTPGAKPTASDIANYRNWMKAVIEAFQLPLAETEVRLEQIRGTFAAYPLAQESAINPPGMNKARQRIIEQRQKALQAIEKQLEK